MSLKKNLIFELEWFWFFLRVKNPFNGVKLDVFSNEIGIQLYTADFLNALLTNGIQRFGKHAGFCLMPDTYPDAVNHVMNKKNKIYSEEVW